MRNRTCIVALFRVAAMPPKTQARERLHANMRQLVFIALGIACQCTIEHKAQLSRTMPIVLRSSAARSERSATMRSGILGVLCVVRVRRTLAVQNCFVAGSIDSHLFDKSFSSSSDANDFSKPWVDKYGLQKDFPLAASTRI